MKLINLFLASVLLITATVASASTSSTYNIGVLDQAPYSVSNHYINNVTISPGSSFVDVYNFSLNNTNLFSGSGAQLPLSFPGYDVLKISNFTLKLFDASNVLAGVPGTTQITDILSNGKYFVTVSGTPTGLAGGNYTFAAAVQAVPEPNAWVMLLAGLGMIGFVTLRRRNVF